MKILELFSGTESFSKVAEARGHEVFTIDIEPKLKPLLCKDILKLEPKDIPFNPDVIWASPPCTDYSHAKRKGISFIEISNMNVVKTFSIILSLNPKYWFIENPQTGTLKFQYFMNFLPYVDVSYCKYDFPYRKMTRLWTNLKFDGKVCNKDCDFIENGKHIASAGNGRNIYTDRNVCLKDKYKVPEKLCIEILKKIESVGDFIPNGRT